LVPLRTRIIDKMVSNLGIGYNYNLVFQFLCPSKMPVGPQARTTKSFAGSKSHLNVHPTLT
jgi:hypothetical protein